MKALFGLSICIVLTLLYIPASAQCPPANSTSTITGLYSSDLIPPAGSVIYVAPSATLTGKITLINSSIYNCGIIQSPKIVMRQNGFINQYVFENRNVVTCDSLLLDSLGHLDNYDTLSGKFLRLRYGSNLSNSYVTDFRKIYVQLNSVFGSQALVKADYLELMDNYSEYYNPYGTLCVRKLLKVGAGTLIYGPDFLCVDSCFINNGIINGQSLQTITPTIKVSGLSQNTGTILTYDFCDLSSTNGGMFDVNTGTTTAVTFCGSQIDYCSLASGIRQNRNYSSIKIFPNPFTDKIGIEFPENFNLSGVSVSIINSLGQMVYTLIDPQPKQDIDVSFLPAGIYLLNLQTGSSRSTLKIIKE